MISPPAVAATLEESLTAGDCSERWTVAGALALVALIDAAGVVAFTPLLMRTYESVLGVLSRPSPAFLPPLSRPSPASSTATAKH